MRRKLLGLLAAAVLVLGFAGQASALFEDLQLVRVVYQNNGTVELATSLGNVNTLAGGSNVTVGDGTSGFQLTDFSGAGWANLQVGYYARNAGLQYDAWTSGPLAGGQMSGPTKIANFTNAATYTAGYYQTLTPTGNTVTAVTTNLNSYVDNMNNGGTSPGTFAAFIPAGNGEVSLAAIATLGYVEQLLYKYDYTSPGNPASAGVAVAKIRTWVTPGADGTLGTADDLSGTTINPTEQVVPIPPAVLLLGSGLLGLIGLRRRAS
ncbi:MAG: hypothetical protein HXY45_09985 [Syntrophaceae bacterium]|nr:hypothetical protein [Syntrophaceae bacterium]